MYVKVVTWLLYRCSQDYIEKEGTWMKKVLAINSSKRKKNTYGILMQLQEQLQKLDIHMDIIQLHDYDTRACAGCEACITTDRCPLRDDVKTLMERLMTYDGIIISTPVYMNGISGQLKNFIDRTCKWAHRPKLYGMPILFVITTAGSGISSTKKYMRNIALQWGAFPTDTISRKVTTLHQKVTLKEYKNFLNLLNKPIHQYKVSWSQMMYFAVYKALAMGLLERDKKYWEEQGWHKKNYYVDSKISILKSIFGKYFYRMLYRKMKANK